MRPEDRRRFRSGRPCLDLVHTGGGVPEHAPFEAVHRPADLDDFLPHVLHRPETRFAATAADLSSFRALRSTITRLALAAVAGRPFAQEDVAALNAAAAAPPLVLALDGDATSVVAPTVPRALATLARDAVDLFGGPLRQRVRECASDNCGLLFVDASRPGTRRWCSMERCGTLAKVRTHREKTR